MPGVDVRLGASCKPKTTFYQNACSLSLFVWVIIALHKPCSNAYQGQQNVLCTAWLHSLPSHFQSDIIPLASLSLLENISICPEHGIHRAFSRDLLVRLIHHCGDYICRSRGTGFDLRREGIDFTHFFLHNKEKNKNVIIY